MRLCFLLLLALAAKTDAQCTSCPNLSAVCVDPELGAIDGVLTITSSTDANGCKVVSITCSDDPLVGDPNSLTVISINDGEFSFLEPADVTCKTDGSWFGQGMNSVSCEVYRPDDSSAGPVTAPTCKSVPAVTINPISTLPPSTTTKAAVTTPTTKPSSTLTSTASTARATTTTAGTPGGCCSQWSNWQSSEPCADMCGACANHTKTRMCLTAATCPCPGPNSITEPCNKNPCGYPRRSCCSPFVARVIGREIVCALPTDELEPVPKLCSCCPEKGIWGEWADGACTDTCGGNGIGTRHRTCLTEAMGCPCTGPNSIPSAHCRQQPCAFPRQSCRTGAKATVMNGAILCLEQTDISPVEQTQCCPPNGVWSSWGSWSPCSTKCGACSNALRRRVCLSSQYGCACDSQPTSQTQPCGVVACDNEENRCCSPFLPRALSNGDVICVASPLSNTVNVWSEWMGTGCNDTCGLCGRMPRNRVCLSPDGCTGQNTGISETPCASKLCTFPRPSCCAGSKAQSNGTAIICAPFPK